MDREATAIELMESFAERSGLVGDQPPRRYLWTDAYAVCTFLALDLRRPERGFIHLARALVEQVHDLLGRHADSRRPLGGLDESTLAAYPTRAGLRIGKPLPERAPGQPFDEQLEWERDGQYFHYLTRWMHALERYALVSKEAEAHRWAVELCQTALAFVQRDAGGRPRAMVWKRSVDLDRVLVPSMGQHDPLDGWVTADELAASPLASDDERARLSKAAATYRSLDAPSAWPTADPLGLGGLMSAARRRWFDRRPGEGPAVQEVEALLHAAARGLQVWIASRSFDAPAAHRLPFRELGLVIGLHAIESIAADPDRNARAGRAARLLLDRAEALPDLSAFWCEAANRSVPSWTEHLDINAVMLAASLVAEE
ncbi:hypothetical protein [Wenzhouxiangella marina]|uniref:Uncharacterized protein n=1 Tax=Wenzhouxiangella marina TaxID=1579979 RepID=A0A0K0XZH0_9GAMM|nr:hypothetical protein [Wenzhouxiangella marina]AKS43032.1 hypothetical protein WM2015_2674 [Wenzhouxiangella marina]MBB6087285.1 hypothetical protein [Wenzhouxiangella marina]